jgi:hypothetical protein
MSKILEIDFSELDRLKQFMNEQLLDEALLLTSDLCIKYPFSPYLWIVRGRLEILIGGSDTNPFGNAEKFLLCAHDINPNDTEALEELTHFYDVIEPNREEAKKFGFLLLEKIEIIGRNIKGLLKDSPTD